MTQYHNTQETCTQVLIRKTFQGGNNPMGRRILLFTILDGVDVTLFSPTCVEWQDNVTAIRPNILYIRQELSVDLRKASSVGRFDGLAYDATSEAGRPSWELPNPWYATELRTECSFPNWNFWLCPLVFLQACGNSQGHLPFPSLIHQISRMRWLCANIYKSLNGYKEWFL